MSARRRRTGGPMSAAGLISFYEEYESGIKISPTTVIMLSTLFTFIVVIAHILG